MSGSSQHCREPHIDTINPKTGEQHMRFQADPLGGNPPATTGFGTASRVNAFGPSMGPQSSASPTIMSMDFAMNAAPGVPPFAGSMQNFSVADSEGNSTGVIMYWDKTYGGVYVYDGAAAGYAFLGYATGNGAYNHLQVDLDPCLGTYSYTFDAVDGVHTYSHANAGQSNTIERIIFAHNNVAGPGWDLDNYNVTRLGGCPSPAATTTSSRGARSATARTTRIAPASAPLGAPARGSARLSALRSGQRGQRTIPQLGWVLSVHGRHAVHVVQRLQHGI